MTDSKLNPEDMTKTERSCLLYIESCCVDRGGILEGVRMNSDDLDAIAKFVEKGLLTRAGRIPFRMVTKNNTHFAELSEEGWKAAHAIRRLRAMPENRGPFATRVFEMMDARSRT